eukprot:gnl/MRDRNA2_/MRDRNA2_195749_c0_seq1.p1 gnl/MRDRNA2_/MRDRNA2_195749_c0~~gnl/MRDRNA2_/MRDRNA2_195749_c0_seq1.p1  ORF type:complete len:562 (-),score=62.98 gnl/MRDRNA2_/MRDRNA2_195749_c0_seq1:25-1680(-)
MLHLEAQPLPFTNHSLVHGGLHEQLYKNLVNHSSPSLKIKINHDREVDKEWLPAIPFHNAEKHRRGSLEHQESIFNAGLKRVPGNRAGLLRMLLRLQAQKPVTILVFGGSVAQGNGCREGKTMWKYCSWPARFVEQLRTAFPRASITLRNYAIGGHTTQGILPYLALWVPPRSEPVDLILLDFGVNDRSLLLTIQEQAHNSFAKFMRIKVKKRQTTREIGVALEVFFRVAQAKQPSAQIVLLCFINNRWLHDCDLGDKNRYYQKFRCDKFAPQLGGIVLEEYATMAEYYGIPLVNYIDAVEADSRLKGPLRGIWSNKLHPDWKAHMYCADLLVHLLNEVSRNITGTDKIGIDISANMGAEELDMAPPFHKKELLDSYHLCLAPLAQHFAVAPGPSSPRNTSSWLFFEDRPGKPGWIAEGIVGNETRGTAEGNQDDNWISFPVSFGPDPRLAVTYLRSYEGLGRAEIRFDGMQEGYTLSGFWPERASQAYTFVFQKASSIFKGKQPVQDLDFGTEVHLGHDLGFGVMPNSSRIVQFRLAEGPKFKLLSVISC